MKRTIIAFAGAASLLVSPMLAQETPDTPVQAGPCEDEIYHAFDFWIGAWDVHDQAGTLQGHNKITREENGCLILEQWTSVNGGTGQSYNFVDPVSREWRQIWVSGAANIDYSGGPTDTGTLRLRGTITYRNGTAFPFMGEWVPQEDGSVRQYFEQYDPESETWKPWFLGLYTRSEVDSGE